MIFTYGKQEILLNNLKTSFCGFRPSMKKDPRRGLLNLSKAVLDFTLSRASRSFRYRCHSLCPHLFFAESRTVLIARNKRRSKRKFIIFFFQPLLAIARTIHTTSFCGSRPSMKKDPRKGLLNLPKAGLEPARRVNCVRF